MKTRQDLLYQLAALGFEINEIGAPRTGRGDNSTRPVLVRLRGTLFAQLPARMGDAHMARVASAALAELRRQGLDTDTAIDRHARNGEIVVEVGKVDPGADLATLRKAALVDSIGHPRAERIALYLRYREAYRERFGEYPDPLARIQRGQNRPILGRCPDCEQPQDQECLDDCRLIDPLAATEPPTTRPRGARPWTPASVYRSRVRRRRT